MKHAKDKILEATYLCIAEKGIAAMSLRDIAKKADVALSQIHYYFADKGTLIIEVANLHMEEERKKLQVYLQDIQEPVLRIEAFIDYLRDQQIHRQIVQKVYFELITMSFCNPDLREKTKQLQERLISFILEEEANFGVNNMALARFVFAFLDGLAIQTLQGASEEELQESYLLFRRAVSYFVSK